LLSGFFVQQRTWITWLSGPVHPALGGAVDPDHHVAALHAQSRMGRDQPAHLPPHAEDGPNWLNDPTIALAMAMLVHIWKSLPFWTLILIAARLAIPTIFMRRPRSTALALAEIPLRHLAVDADALRDLHDPLDDLDAGDFNSVYLLTGGGPGDLTHVLATLGIRYLRLDQVDSVDRRHRVRAAAGASACLLHDETGSRDEVPSAREVATEAKLLLIGIRC
jgi:multiple sugar transport system permease protein